MVFRRVVKLVFSSSRVPEHNGMVVARMDALLSLHTLIGSSYVWFIYRSSIGRLVYTRLSWGRAWILVVARAFSLFYARLLAGIVRRAISELQFDYLIRRWCGKRRLRTTDASTAKPWGLLTFVYRRFFSTLVSIRALSFESSK